MGMQLVQNGFKSVRQFFETYEPGMLVLPPRIHQILDRPISIQIQRQVEKDLGWMSGDSRFVMSIFDSDYPYLLHQIHDPPLCLHLWGNRQLLTQDKIALVGSRKPTQLGLKIASMFAGILSELGVVVTSGMAYGIDAAGHIGALNHSGETIAVLGTGCDLIYPRSHERLASRILEKGLLVSEFPLGTGGLARNFPQRNRIVTGVSLGTLVVEAALKSGSLISARLAMEQGREVFAVPGSIFSAQSAGCHQLIKDGAKLTQSIDDIVAELPNKQLVPVASLPLGLSDNEQKVLNLISAAPVNTDGLFEASGLVIQELVSVLVKLEIEGLILEESRGFVRSA